MSNLYSSKGFLKIALEVLTVILALTPLAAALPAEPQDSPLYGRSLRDAFADMTARDQGLVPEQVGVAQAPEANAVLLVTGLQWSRGSAENWATFAELKVTRVATGQARPLDLTYAVSCSLPTSQCASCMATRCGGGPTCVHTCLDPGPTCLVKTCNGEATCSGTTCGPYTCVGTTCMGTCVPANCPTAFSNVRVFQAGQIQVSFNSSAQLKYVLQYCTNLTERVWREACTTNGNGGVLTLVHTNDAESSAYRLLIQNP